MQLRKECATVARAARQKIVRGCVCHSHSPFSFSNLQVWVSDALLHMIEKNIKLLMLMVMSAMIEYRKSLPLRCL